MEKFKIRVKNPEHSKKIQEKLFEMGYSWNCYFTRQKITFQNIYAPFLYVGFGYYDGEISYSLYNSEEYFNRHPLPEVELIETISYEFKEIPKRNVVKVGEFSYYEEELAEALKNIKPI